MCTAVHHLSCRSLAREISWVAYLWNIVKIFINAILERWNQMQVTNSPFSIKLKNKCHETDSTRMDCILVFRRKKNQEIDTLVKKHFYLFSPQSRYITRLFLQSSNWDHLTRRRVSPLPLWFWGGDTLACGKGGESQFGRGDRHCGTPGIYVLCDFYTYLFNGRLCLNVFDPLDTS